MADCCHPLALLVLYPSGQRVIVRGDFVMVTGLSTGPGPGIERTNDVIMLDPRCIVRHLHDPGSPTTGCHVYCPRCLPLDEHQQWVRDHLADNPDWAATCPRPETVPYA